MRRLVYLCFTVALLEASVAQDEGYPPGTLAPAVDLALQPVVVQVPPQLADQVPEGLSLNMPAGFSVSLFAGGLNGPRFMAFDENEVLHVANMRSDQIVALPDRDQDGVADEQIVAARGFKEAHSLAFYQGEMYVADTDAIIKYRDLDGDLVYEESEVLVDLTSPGACCNNGWHTTRTIVIDEADQKIYVGIGSPCDLCRSSAPTKAGGTDPLPPNPEWGSILEFNIDGSGKRIFATGVRNTVGLTLHPVSGELWGNNNGHDLEGRTSPPEWIDVIRDGDFMGHPFVNSHQVWNNFEIERYQRLLPLTPEDSLLAASQKRPVALVPAHYAPMGIHFYRGAQFPERYRNMAFVAFRAGQAKNSSHPGYNVSALFSDPDGSNAQIGEFITGFQTGTTERSVWGLPVGLVTDREGSLYVSSDNRNHVILKVTYSQIGGTWQHNLPDNLAFGASLAVNATVQVDRLDPEGGAVRLWADLSAFGGPAALPLVGEDDTYRLQTSLDLDRLMPGPYLLRILLEQDGVDKIHRFQFSKLITLLSPDLYILDDSLTEGWGLLGEGGAEALALGAGPVFHGKTAQPVLAVAESFTKPWTLGLQPSSGVGLFGVVGLRLVFHPGDLEAPNVSRLNLFINERSVNLLQDGTGYQVDLERRQWQIVEIPFESFRFRDPIETVETIRLVGNATGTFYLDDIRLVTAIPASAPTDINTAVLEQVDDVAPADFALQQNYPNPFNSATAIRYVLPQKATVVLAVYNLAGQEVARLVYGLRQAGAYTVAWDGRDNADQQLASGVYIYRLRAGTDILTRKLLLLR